MAERWSVDEARAWGERQPWLFGANFTPSTAINQLEMWQAETFDPETIERELGYAQGIGMNIMRVYLHDLLWEHDRDGFVERLERYLDIAYARGIRTMFTIFDDCWHGGAKLGKQPEPKPRTHNSGWLQSPGHAVAEDPAQWPRLKRYVTELLNRFRDDPRVAVWDLYNEPGNEEGTSGSRYEKAIPIVEATFEWARSVEGRTQPLTVGYWTPHEGLARCILDNSDIITFHSYSPPEKGLAEMARRCLDTGRPVICTEYMARSAGSTFEVCTPYLKERGIGAINWGLVSGKTQTIYPWHWNADKGEPEVLFHDIFRPDGTFLVPEEEAHIRAAVGS